GTGVGILGDDVVDRDPGVMAPRLEAQVEPESPRDRGGVVEGFPDDRGDLDGPRTLADGQHDGARLVDDLTGRGIARDDAAGGDLLVERFAHAYLETLVLERTASVVERLARHRGDLDLSRPFGQDQLDARAPPCRPARLLEQDRARGCFEIVSGRGDL